MNVDLTCTILPAAFDTIEAPKHRSHIELIRASRHKSVVPSKKFKSSHGSDSDDSSDEDVPEVVEAQANKPIIDGRPLKMRSAPLDIKSHTSCGTVM